MCIYIYAPSSVRPPRLLRKSPRDRLYLSTYRSIYLSISIYPSIYICIYIYSIYTGAHPLYFLFIFSEYHRATVFIYLHIDRSIYLYLYLSIYLSIYICIYIYSIYTRAHPLYFLFIFGEYNRATVLGRNACASEGGEGGVAGCRVGEHGHLSQ